MVWKLTVNQKAKVADCSCPLPSHTKRIPLSKKAIIIPFAIFAGFLYLAWALWPPAFLWLIGIYGVLVVGNAVYRLSRGHTLWCVVRWSPVAALYIIGDGVAAGL